MNETEKEKWVEMAEVIVGKESCGLKASMCLCAKLIRHVWLSAMPWTVAHLAPLSVGFFRQEHWSASPVPTQKDLHNPVIKPASLALQADSLPLSHRGSLNSAFSAELRNFCQLRSQRFSSMFSSRSLIILGFTFKSMIHFKLIF